MQKAKKLIETVSDNKNNTWKRTRAGAQLRLMHCIPAVAVLMVINLLLPTGCGCSGRSAIPVLPGSSAVVCDPSIGTVEPASVCTQTDPCTAEELMPLYAQKAPPILQINTPSTKPVCSTSQHAIVQGRAAYDDGPPLEWTDANGVIRYRCEARPPGTSQGSRRPLVIWIPGSGGSATTVYDNASLRDKMAAYDLTGDPTRPGFILVSVQPRNLHWPTEDPEAGAKHDTYYRDLNSPSTNLDIAHIDHIIDELAAESVVDASRIYIMGWSNGGRFAALYGIARHETQTPGGHRIAAVANYSAGDPFENIRHDYKPSCKQDSYPQSAVPVYLISRTCDVIACNPAQDQAFQDEGVITTPGNIAETWIADLMSKVGSATVDWKLINTMGADAVQCAPAGACSSPIAVVNHLRWPDGVADGGSDHEPDMLNFLKGHQSP